jgi:hypothetical protein
LILAVDHPPAAATDNRVSALVILLVALQSWTWVIAAHALVIDAIFCPVAPEIVVAIARYRALLAPILVLIAGLLLGAGILSTSIRKAIAPGTLAHHTEIVVLRVTRIVAGEAVPRPRRVRARASFLIAQICRARIAVGAVQIADTLALPRSSAPRAFSTGSTFPRSRVLATKLQGKAAA